MQREAHDSLVFETSIVEMGALESKPIKDFSKEDISRAVGNLGEPYQKYVTAFNGNGVDGALLDMLSIKEIDETLDDLGITNRLHRRVLLSELNKAKLCNNDFVAFTYDYSPFTSNSDLEPYQEVTEKCLRQFSRTAVLAGVHLVLDNGNQLSLDTKKLENGIVVTDKLHRPRRSSLCSSIVNDGRNQDYYKMLFPNEIQKTLFQDTTSPMAYTGYILKNEAGKREGILCMVDRCNPSDVVDIDREAFLRQLAKDIEHQLRLRKQLLNRRKVLQHQIIGCQSKSDNREESVSDVILSAHGPIKPVLKSQVEQRVSKGNPLSFSQQEKRASHKLPFFQNMSTEEERAHLPSNFYDCVDAISCPRPPIAKNDMECAAIVEALGLTDIDPDDEIAFHLKGMVKMATQVFGFPNAEITFRNHETIFCMAGYGQNEEIVKCADVFPALKRNKDGTKFLWSMPRALSGCNYVLALAGTFVVQDIAADETFDWLAASTPVRCYVGTAIKDSCGRPIAVLCMHDIKARPDFEAAHEIQLEQLASLIAQSIENWALRRSIDRLEIERKMHSRGNDKHTLPKDNVTFVLTDIEGCIDMWEANPAAMQRGQSIHDDIIKELCAGNFGYEVATEGHTFTLAFHDPEDAFGFALHAQAALFDAKWPEDLLRLPHAKEEQGAFRGFRVKMAVHQGHVGSISESEQEGNYSGEAMNITKTLLQMAHGGQILSTAETWDVASYFMGSTLEFPQVLDHGCHVIRKGMTTRDGVITKRIIQLIPSKLAYDYFAARKLSHAPEENRHYATVNKQCPGRHFPPVLSLKHVSPSFHDAPFVDNEVTMAFVNLSAIDELEASSVVNLIGIILDGIPEFGGYQCQSEMLAFHRPLDAILFGLHLHKELESRGAQRGGICAAGLITFACVHECFLTMGPHRATGRADYFGKIVNRAARLCKAVALGSVCFGVVCSEGNDKMESERKNVDPISDPSIECRFSGRKRLKGIPEEVAVYEYKARSTLIDVK